MVKQLAAELEAAQAAHVQREQGLSTQLETALTQTEDARNGAAVAAAAAEDRVAEVELAIADMPFPIEHLPQ